MSDNVDRVSGAGIVGTLSAQAGTSIDATNRNEPSSKDERQGKP